MIFESLPKTRAIIFHLQLIINKGIKQDL